MTLVAPADDPETAILPGSTPRASARLRIQRIAAFASRTAGYMWLKLFPYQLEALKSGTKAS